MVDEQRVWPLPGDLGASRNATVIASALKRLRGGEWMWMDDGGSRGPFSGSTRVPGAVIKGQTPGIIVTCLNLDWFAAGKTKRPVVFVLVPDSMGWDDYGNYDVIERPAEPVEPA